MCIRDRFNDELCGGLFATRRLALRSLRSSRAKQGDSEHETNDDLLHGLLLVGEVWCICKEIPEVRQLLTRDVQELQKTKLRHCDHQTFKKCSSRHLTENRQVC